LKPDGRREATRTPSPAYGESAGTVAFSPALMDTCFVGEEMVRAQPGGFHGGCVTGDVVRPFKIARHELVVSPRFVDSR